MTATFEHVSNYVPVSRRPLDLEDYIDIARRHRNWVAGPTLAGIVIATVVAFVMPNVYVSQAEMEITPAQVSETIVKSTVNQRLNDRIIQMEQEILSRTVLSQIIQDPRLDLYKPERAKEPLEDVIEKMRTNDIKIKIESSADNRGASAFFISFQYPDRTKARDTVQALVTKFTDQNQVTQSTGMTVVKNLVHDELSDAKAKLDQLNEQITNFRLENAGKLPEQASFTIAQLTSLQGKSATINDSLNRLAQERIQYDTRLQSLESQKELREKFDQEDAASNTEFATPLVKQQSQRLQTLNAAIEKGESDLAMLKRNYRPSFPAVRDAETALAEYRKQRDELQKKQDDEFAKAQADAADAAKSAKPKPAPKTNATNALAMNKLESDIDAVKAQIKSLELQREALIADQQRANKEIDADEGRIAATSGLEAKYEDLRANQKAAADKYLEIQRKQELTDQNSDLLQRKAGENLEVLDVPSLPNKPSKPNRWLIVGAGTAISFILGLALAGLQEAKDTSLKNLKDVRAYTNLPVLSSIPLLENTMLVRRKRRFAYLGWSAAIIVGLLAVSAALYYHYTSAV
jgi:uncharacterized protein involved in exopolysaccharide biosynthesis